MRVLSLISIWKIWESNDESVYKNKINKGGSITCEQDISF